MTRCSNGGTEQDVLVLHNVKDTSLNNVGKMFVGFLSRSVLDVCELAEETVNYLPKGRYKRQGNITW